jgi:hypothetical protein
MFRVLPLVAKVISIVKTLVLMVTNNSYRSNRLSEVMLALVSYMFIQIQNGDNIASSNHRDVLPSTKFAPLIFFYYQCVTQWQIIINVLSTKNHMWFFSGQHTDSKKNSGREQVPVFQHSKICKDWSGFVRVMDFYFVK